VRIGESARQDAGTGGRGDGETTTQEAISPRRRVTASPRLTGVIEVRELRRPRAGVVITGNEVYHGRIKDAFAPIITRKIEAMGGEIVGIAYAPDDEQFIEDRLRELLAAGADLLITTGGMSVDPDDVTRFAIRNLGATDITYGSAVLPGAMVLVGYVENDRRGDAETRRRGEAEMQDGETRRHGDAENLSSEPLSPRPPVTLSPRPAVPYSPRPPITPSPIPILGIPACGMYHQTTIFDLILPRVLAGERIGRTELAEMGHGGLCLHCKECRYPVCPFGK
jgi:formylmethanofuran dehydrogenase subunit E